MADEADAFRGFSILSPAGRRSPTVNEHSKQPQQQHPPCTTQASLPATTQGQADTLSLYYTPSNVASPHTVDTVVPGYAPDSSQSPGRVAEGTQDSRIGPPRQDLVLEQHQCRQYGSEELQQRLEGMWPNHQLKSENYDPCGAQRLVSDKAAGDFPASSLSANPLQDNNHYEKRLLSQHVWPSDPQNPLQQSIWRPFSSSTQISSNQPLYWPSRLSLVASVDDFPSTIHPGSYSGTADNLKFEAADTDYLNFIPTSSPYAGYQTGVDTIATTALSPLRASSTVAYEAPQGMPQDQEDNVEFSEWRVGRDNGMGYKEDLWCPEDSPPSMEPSGGKVDEPYAQLIYKAFMSTPNKSMNLQQIYEWFRNNTDKAKSEGKGWQNSIRHNLSMNGVITHQVPAKQGGIRLSVAWTNIRFSCRPSPSATPRRRSATQMTAAYLLIRLSTAENPRSGISSPNSSAAWRVPPGIAGATMGTDHVPAAAATPRAPGMAVMPTGGTRTGGCQQAGRGATSRRRTEGGRPRSSSTHARR